MKLQKTIFRGFLFRHCLVELNRNVTYFMISCYYWYYLLFNSIFFTIAFLANTKYSISPATNYISGQSD